MPRLQSLPKSFGPEPQALLLGSQATEAWRPPGRPTLPVSAPTRRARPALAVVHVLAASPGPVGAGGTDRCLAPAPEGAPAAFPAQQAPPYGWRRRAPGAGFVLPASARYLAKPRPGAGLNPAPPERLWLRDSAVSGH